MNRTTTSDLGLAAIIVTLFTFGIILAIRLTGGAGTEAQPISPECARVIEVANGLAAQGEYIEQAAHDYHHATDPAERETLQQSYDNGWDAFHWTVEEFDAVEGACQR